MTKNMKKVILIKLGGSIITDKKIAYKLRSGTIKRLAKELKNSNVNLVIAHGNGSFGHTSSAKYGGMRGYKNKAGIAKVAQDVSSLNQIITNALVKENLPAISIRPMAMILTNEGKMKKHLFEVVEEMIMQGLIPVMCGDILWDRVWKSTIYSGEKILNEMAIFLKSKGYKIEKIIQVGETDGVFDNKRKTIPLITKKNWSKIKEYVYKQEVKDVSGGMRHKIENALSISELGIKTLLINGQKKHELYNAIKSKRVRGTLIQ